MGDKVSVTIAMGLNDGKSVCLDTGALEGLNVVEANSLLFPQCKDCIIYERTGKSCSCFSYRKKRKEE